MVVDYRDDSPFTDELHTIPEIADALRHKKYGVDVREAIAQAVEKLGQTGNTIYASGNPAGSFATEEALETAYPNGQDGVFIVTESGLWYTWNPRTDVWEAGGPYQAPMSTTEVEDGRVWADGTTTSSKIGDAIRGQFKRVKSELDRIDYTDKEQDSQINQIKDELEQVENTDEELDSRIKYHETALELKEVRLRDNDGDLLWNGNSYITGKVVLPKTDKTGLEEGIPADSSIVGSTFLAHFRDYGLPVIELEHPDLLSLKSKADGKLSGVRFKLGNYEETLDSIKVQGSSSQRYPKKNYTIKFDNPIQIVDSWGSHRKYVLKADWVDFSHMRNEFGAFLWRKIRETRINNDQAVFVDNNGNNLVRTVETTFAGETRNKYAMGLNLGAIDSRQVLVVINGEYHGLYSLNIPKDDWMAGMGRRSHEAIVSAETHTLATNFKEHAAVDSDGNLTGDDFSIEYVPDEDDQSWVADSINSLIDSVMTKEDVPNHLDVDSAIDYLILNLVDQNADAIDKNWLLDTWDGNYWCFVPYDMDSSFGNNWDGKSILNPTTVGLPAHSNNAVFNLIMTDYSDLFTERWNNLRSTVLSETNLYTLIYNFAMQIPNEVLDYEQKLWTAIPGTRTNNFEQIISWLPMRLSVIDAQIKSLS